MSDQLLVLALLLVPLAAAVGVWALGPSRGDAVRSTSALASAAILLLALLLAGRFLSLPRETPDARDGQVNTFVPEFVPGSTPDNPNQTTWNILPVGKGNIQLFLGVDGINVWLVVLTA